MAYDTTNKTTGKRTRAGTVLTDRLCETRPRDGKRKKYNDRRTRGLYVSITPAGVATFSCNFTNAAGRATSRKIGVYHPETFKVARARAEVAALKAKGGAAIGVTLRQRRDDAAKQGVTVDNVIDKYVEWIKTPELKEDGEMRPRVESWTSTASYLRRFASPCFGGMIASEVTSADVGRLLDDILDGELGKPSPSNARHVRIALSGMFQWSAVPKRGYVAATPCVNLGEMPKEYARTRVLSEDEIRTLWHGLDREDLPWDRKTRLGLKFALTTMLRSWEALGIHRDELNPAEGTVDIPARRVKLRRVINQPLSDLALEILAESMGESEWAFAGRFGDAPLARHAMSSALHGTTHTVNGKRATRTPGICELLGMKPFRPHDLRRTAATFCGDLEDVSEFGISLCLDHQPKKDANGNALPAITNKVYNLATRKRINEKRRVLDRWAVELRRIIAQPVAVERPETELLLAA